MVKICPGAYVNQLVGWLVGYGWLVGHFVFLFVCLFVESCDKMYMCLNPRSTVFLLSVDFFHAASQTYIGLTSHDLCPFF
jgi:hypothetical protein